MCLGIFLLGFFLYGTLCASWTWLTISFSMLGKFSTIISKHFLIQFLFLFFFWDLYNLNVGAFDIVPEVSETILGSFQSFYFILLFRSYFYHFIFQLTALFFCFRYSANDSFGCWEGLGAGGEGENRGWDGWMASPIWCTWVWVNSGSWWWTGRPGMLRFMGSQRVGHDWATELNWTVAHPEIQTQVQVDYLGSDPKKHP